MDLSTLQFASKIRCHSLYQKAKDLFPTSWESGDCKKVSDLIGIISKDTDLPKFAVAQQISKDAFGQQD